MGITEQISDALAGHKEQIEEGIEKIGDFIDSTTGGKFAAKVDQVQDFLKDKLDGEPQA